MKRLEVLIQEDNTIITASSPTFPDCVGTGKTVKQALSALSTAISRHIAKQAKSIFKTLLYSDKYDDVVLYTQADDDHASYKRSYPLFQDNSPIKMIKVALENTPDNLFLAQDQDKSDEPDEPDFTPFIEGDSKIGSTFGFPISFN